MVLSKPTTAVRNAPPSSAQAHSPLRHKQLPDLGNGAYIQHTYPDTTLWHWVKSWPTPAGALPVTLHLVLSWLNNHTGWLSRNVAQRRGGPVSGKQTRMVAKVKSKVFGRMLWHSVLPELPTGPMSSSSYSLGLQAPATWAMGALVDQMAPEERNFPSEHLTSHLAPSVTATRLVTEKEVRRESQHHSLPGCYLQQQSGWTPWSPSAVTHLYNVNTKLFTEL